MSVNRLVTSNLIDIADCLGKAVWVEKEQHEKHRGCAGVTAIGCRTARDRKWSECHMDRNFV